MNLFTKQKDSETQRTNYGYQWGRVGGWYSQGVWDQHAHTALFEMDNQQGPTVQHRELCLMLCTAWMGGMFRGEWIHVCIWLSPFAVHLKLSQHCQSAILQYNSFKKKKTTASLDIIHQSRRLWVQNTVLLTEDRNMTQTYSPFIKKQQFYLFNDFKVKSKC